MFSSSILKIAVPILVIAAIGFYILTLRSENKTLLKSNTLLLSSNESFEKQVSNLEVTIENERIRIKTLADKNKDIRQKTNKEKESLQNKINKLKAGTGLKEGECYRLDQNKTKEFNTSSTNNLNESDQNEQSQ